MKRSPPPRPILGVLAGGLLLGGLALVQEAEAPSVEVVAAAGPVHMLVGRGGNVGVSAGPDGMLIVDDQFEFMAPGIEAALDSLGDHALEFVLNTHWHGDHVGGNVHFGQQAPVLAHENVRARMSAEQTLFGEAVPAQPPEALPVVTFQDGLSIHFNGEEIRVVHMPAGHTDGDSIVVFGGSNVVHTGDLFFHGRFPFIDVENGGSARGMVAAVDRLLEMVDDDTRIIPGHGPLSTRDDLLRYREMLGGVIAVVESAIDGGKGTAEIVAEGLLDPWSEWGGGFITAEQFAAILFSDLSR